MDRRLFLSLSIPAAGAIARADSTRPAARTQWPAAAALGKLKAGNQRFAASKPVHPHQESALRVKLSTGQHPFATVLCCSDSRVAPELIFDEGLGDLFVVRVAGNIVDDAIIGSIEYSTEHLGIPLVVVLGHSNCGAVTAAAEAGESHDHIDSLVRAIRPSVQSARRLAGDPIANAVRLNVQRSCELLRTSTPRLASRVALANLRVVGAVYDLKSGQVDWLA